MLQASSLALIGMLTVVGCGGSDNPPIKRDGGIDVGGAGGNPGGVVKVDKAVLDFGSIDVGSASTAQTVTVTVSVAPVAINATVTGSGFAISGTTCAPVQAIGSCTISVKFAPAGIGAATGALSVGTASVALSGTGQTAGTFSVTDRVDLGTLLVGASASAVVQVVPSPSVTGLTCIASGSNLTLASQTCAATGAISAPCSFTFTFKAATAGAKSDAVVCSAGGTTKQTTVAATVVTPSQLSINPPTAALAASVGATDTQTFVVSNNGGSPTGNLSATISAGATDYAITSNDCVVPLASLAVCRIQVTFKPTSAGAAKTGTLTVVDATVGSTPAKADLTGTAVAASAVSITPNPSDFGSVQVGAPKATSFTVKNSGGTATDAIKLSTGGTEFVVDAALCNGLPLAAGAQCVFTVTFAPTSTGAKSASIIAEAAGIAVATAKVTGTATAASTGPVLAITPPTLDFGTTGVGVPVGPLVLTVRNSGDTATGVLSVVKKDSPSSVGGASQFSFTTTCSAALAAGETCQVAVTYSPTIAGSASGVLTISDGAVSTANGTVIGIALSIPTLKIDCGNTTPSPKFDDTLVGKTSAAVVCTVSNTTDVANQTPQESGAITAAVTGDFAISANTCTASLAPNTSCTLSVTFKPTAKGERTGALTVSSTNKGAANKPLTATGLLTVEIVEVAGTTVVTAGNYDFGQVSTGGSASVVLTLAVYVRGQVGNIAITGTDIKRLTDTAPANFTQVAGTAAGTYGTLALTGNDCASLKTYTVPAANTTPVCFMFLSFTPQSKGAKTTTVTATGADSSTDNAAAKGTGTGPLTISPTALTFDAVAIGSSSVTPLTLTVCNNAPTSGTGTTVSVTGANAAEFAIVEDNVSNQTLASAGGNPQSANCKTIKLRLDVPATDTAGARAAQVKVTTTIAGASESATADLVGSAGNPGLLTATLSGPFADTAVTATSAPVTVTVTNTGALATNVLSFNIPATGADFIYKAADVPAGQAQGTCTETNTKLNPNDSCTLKVWFRPAAALGVSKRTTTLTVSSSVGGIVTLDLSANATSQLAISPNTVQDTGLSAVTTDGNPDPAAPIKTFTITNLGGVKIDAGTLNFSFVQANSDVADTSFRVKRNGCTGDLGPAGSTTPADTCTIDVQLFTAVLGPHAATLRVTNTANNTQRVSVPVTGTAAQVANLAFTAASQVARDFGMVLLGQTSIAQRFTVVNRGGFPSSAVTFSFVETTTHTKHTKTADFDTTGTTCVGDGAVIPAGGSCDIVVAFHPTQCALGDTACGTTTSTVAVDIEVVAANGTPGSGIVTRPTLAGVATSDTVATYIVESSSGKAPFDFGQITSLSTVNANATGTITPVAGSALADAETFTLNDGINTAVVFEFDNDGSVTAGNVAVAFTAATTVANVALAIRNAINGVGAGLGITASVGSNNVVNLVNDAFGPYNTAITDTVTDAGFVVTGMSGGSRAKTVQLAIHNTSTTPFTVPASITVTPVVPNPLPTGETFVVSKETGDTCVFGTTVLGAGTESCTFTVTWTPVFATTGTRVVKVAAGAVSMNLIGRVPTPAKLEQLPNSPAAPLDFGNVIAGVDSPTLAVTIQNTGEVATDGDLQTVTTTPVPQHASEVTVVSGCQGTGSALAGGKSCVLSLKVHPGTSGTVSSFTPVTVKSLGTTTPVQTGVSVKWVGVDGASITPSPTSVAFDTTAVPGTPVLSSSAARTVTLANNGAVSTGPLSISVDNDNFAVSLDTSNADSCLAPSRAFTGIAAAGSCTVQLVFRPVALATPAKTGNLKVTSTSGASATVGLTGTAIAALKVSVTGTSGGTFTAATGTAGASFTYTATSITAYTDQIFRFTNTGDVATGLLSTGIGGATGSTPDQFKTVTDGCVGVSVAAGQYCDVTVRFAPNATGANKNAVVTVLDPSSGTPADSVSVAVKGNANP